MTKLLLPLGLLLLLLPGCSSLDNCPDDPDKSIVVDTGTSDTDALFYESCPWEGPRDAFPAKTCLHFVHGLGATPELVQPFVSFTSRGSDVTVSPGNQSRIKCVDDTEIVIKNDTCEEDFFIRVSASASGSKHTDVACRDRDLGCPASD